MGAAVVVSISVDPAVVDAGRSARVTVVTGGVAGGVTGRGGPLTVPLQYQSHPAERTGELLASAVDSIVVPEGRMSASVDLKTVEGGEGGRVVIIANPGPASVSTTLTVRPAATESPGPRAVNDRPFAR